MANIDGLKRTILTLVSVVVAVRMLEQFVDTKPEAFSNPMSGWGLYALVGLGIILVLSGFIWMNLQVEPRKSPEEFENE